MMLTRSAARALLEKRYVLFSLMLLGTISRSFDPHTLVTGRT